LTYYKIKDVSAHFLTNLSFCLVNISEDGKGFLLKTTTQQSGERILDGNPADCELTEANQQCSKAGTISRK
jgi:hypothetical protein